MLANLLLAPLVCSSDLERPRFSFGVIADVQYADQAPVGARAYRDSLGKLEACAAALARERPAFVVQLGDLVDAGLDNLDRVLPIWGRVPGPRHHVLGNHDLVAPRAKLLKRLGMRAPYYEFTHGGWRFLVLNGVEESAESPAGGRLLEALRAERAPNAQDWNGAVGATQRAWLGQRLAEAARRKQRAIVFCHLPALGAACRPEHLLWDHREVLAILEAQPTAAAYFSGHDHRGGYAERNGIHHLTMPGLVEHDAATACSVVDVFTGWLIVRPAGAGGGRELRLAAPPW